MKKYIALLAVIVSTILNAQAQQGYTEIKGISKKSNPYAVKLYKVIFGRMEEIASSTPNENDAF